MPFSLCLPPVARYLLRGDLAAQPHYHCLPLSMYIFFDLGYLANVAYVE